VAAATKGPPPFPVVAPPKSGKTTPPIPHINVKEEPAMPEAGGPAKKVPAWKTKKFQIGALAAVIVLGGGGFFAYTKMMAPPPPPPPVVVKPKAPAAAVATKPAPAAPASGLTQTQNAVAHAPVNAVNKAGEAVAKREGSGQGRDAVGAVTDDAAPAAANSAPAPQTVSAVSTIAPGVTATNDNVTAAAEASPAFRSFVANAKINGVFQGEPARVMLNGRLARAGDVVESALGIVFDSVDADRKLIVFKDKAGAIVTRRY
jgi:hypothetical protein